jgi:ABC-2 type transport system permease protein
MSIKKIFNVFRLDLANSKRDKVMIYTLLAPIILAFVLKLISPGFQNLSVNFVSLEGDTELVGRLERYGNVELSPTLEKLKERVLDSGDTIGVYLKDGTYSLLMQGNEPEEIQALAKLVLSGILSEGISGVEFETTDNGKTLPPMTLFGFSFVVVLSFTLGGFIIGFNIIDEKESGAMRALMITPISKSEFIVGRSIIGVAVPLIHALLAVLVFAIGGIDILKLIIVTISSSFIGIAMGFLIGVMSSNQMSGLANMKISVLLLLMPVMLAFVLPENRQFIFYWSPTYWSFAALRDILNQSSEWATFLIQLLWITLTTAVIFMIMRGKIKTGLQNYQS